MLALWYVRRTQTAKQHKVIIYDKIIPAIPRPQRSKQCTCHNSTPKFNAVKNRYSHIHIITHYLGWVCRRGTQSIRRIFCFWLGNWLAKLSDGFRFDVCTLACSICIEFHLQHSQIQHWFYANYPKYSSRTVVDFFRFQIHQRSTYNSVIYLCSMMEYVRNVIITAEYRQKMKRQNNREPSTERLFYRCCLGSQTNLIFCKDW